MQGAADIGSRQHPARLGRAGEDVIVGPEPVFEHSTEEVKGEEGEVVMGKCGDDGAPRSGGVVRGFVEDLAGKVGFLKFGVEVDEVVGEERDGLEAGFGDVGVELLAFLEGFGASEGEEEITDLAEGGDSQNASFICPVLVITRKHIRDLGNSYISGTLVPELSELQHLKYLELYNNNLQGQIPVELGNLKNLISMDLYGNALEGEIPSSFSKLKSLKFLRLNNNKLVGSIPRALSALSNLTFLDVSNNNLCGTIPVDGPFENFPVQSFQNNSRLSGPELQGLVPYDLGC
ncbi:hypothetical protein Scep_001131 [Stephania cephalantha]|uniref:Disease resistance R13L4/SHOC-2-like LRR domain-containing protein n=1 Tax=Stephania cephalantha TaxID=152367 RepID=A0AAP0Q3I3_9MAGN